MPAGLKKPSTTRFYIHSLLRFLPKSYSYEQQLYPKLTW